MFWSKCDFFIQTVEFIANIYKNQVINKSIKKRENMTKMSVLWFIFNLHNTHDHHIPPRLLQMVGKPEGNPCRPPFFFEVLLHAAATRGYKWQACSSVGSINIITSYKHFKKGKREVTVVQKQTVITFKPEYQHTWSQIWLSCVTTSYYRHSAPHF